MKKSSIAILGSNSHIAKGLIDNFLKDQECSVHLYTRSPEKVRRFLRSIGKLTAKDCHVHKGYEDLQKRSFEVIINCIGVGTLSKHKGDYTRYFTVNEKHDNLVIEYLLARCPKALYISFSSGVVYGKGFIRPAQENAANCISVNHVCPQDYYALTKIYTEAKHRSFKDLRIVDLRLFSYFSRFVDLKDGYFITEILDSILHNKVLMTSAADIIRDYVHPLDLYAIIKKCMKLKNINTAFDVISAKPVSKKEILKYFSSMYGLKYKVKKSLRHASATGEKNIYCSSYNKARKIGYKPNYSAMDTIRLESKNILEKA